MSLALQSVVCSTCRWTFQQPSCLAACLCPSTILPVACCLLQKRVNEYCEENPAEPECRVCECPCHFATLARCPLQLRPCCLLACVAANAFLGLASADDE
jgi:hypothetical protein